MRFVDLLTLALSALWQRPGRTVMTTAGVVIGTHVLASTLAIGQGVQTMILEQLRKQDQLRRVMVWKTGGVRESEVPAEALEIPGEMTAARRARLREAIVRRYRRPAVISSTSVTPEDVAALERLPYVESVTPGLSWTGPLRLGEKMQTGLVVTTSPDDRAVPRRLVAGRFLERDENGGALVSEYLAYRWGFTDEGDVESLLGRKIQLRTARSQPDVGVLLSLLNAGGKPLSEEQRKTLEGMLPKLPALLAKADLTAREKEVLVGLLAGPPREVPVVEDLPIVGVFRDVRATEQSPWDGPIRGVDVLVPGDVAMRMQVPQSGRRSTAGLPWVLVRVEDENRLKEVQEGVVALGLEAFSLAEVVDQVKVTVLLVSAACTLVAVVSLAVAGLGIANTMLMSVLQRTHEIGVMKAVGARDGQVMALFLLEGALIGALGAGVGLLTSWLGKYPGDRFARYLIEKQTPMRLEGSVHEYSLWMLLAIPAGVIVWTTLAAASPARRAARIDPIEALRSR